MEKKKIIYIQEEEKMQAPEIEDLIWQSSKRGSQDEADDVIIPDIPLIEIPSVEESKGLIHLDSDLLLSGFDDNGTNMKS